MHQEIYIDPWINRNFNFLFSGSSDFTKLYVCENVML